LATWATNPGNSTCTVPILAAEAARSGIYSSNVPLLATKAARRNLRSISLVTYGPILKLRQFYSPTFRRRPGNRRGLGSLPRGRALRMSSCHIRIACHGKAASPVVGRAVYAFIPEVSFSCPLILLRWQIRLTCKASSSKNQKKKKSRHVNLYDNLCFCCSISHTAASCVNDHALKTFRPSRSHGPAWTFHHASGLVGAESLVLVCKGLFACEVALSWSSPLLLSQSVLLHGVSTDVRCAANPQNVRYVHGLPCMGAEAML